MRDVYYRVQGQTIAIPSFYSSLIKSKFKKEIANEYGWSTATFSRKLKKKGVRVSERGYLSVEEVIKIYEALSWPSMAV